MMIYLFWSLKLLVSRQRLNSVLLSVILGIWLTAGGAFAAAQNAPAKLNSIMHTRYFTVHYDSSDPILAEVMESTARENLLRISKELGYELQQDRPFPLYVYSTHIDFIKAGGLEGSLFTVGTTYSANERISVDASGVFALPEEVLAHEITHAIIFRILGSSISELPLWANEGIAKFESDDFADSDNQAITDAASEGTLMLLGELTLKFPKDRTSLAYAESASAITYMVKKNGRSSIRTMLDDLARTGSFDKAMLRVSTRTADQFASDWYAYTTKRYWGVKLSRIATQIAAFVMAVLAVAAFLARRKQKREAAKQWEQEEFEEALRRQLGNDWWR